MRWFTSALIALLPVLGAPVAAHADCTLFSPDGPACAAPKAKMQVDFAKLAAAKDLRERVRTSPGDRPRRTRTQAVPLSPSLARGPR